MDNKKCESANSGHLWQSFLAVLYFSPWLLHRREKIKQNSFLKVLLNSCKLLYASLTLANLLILVQFTQSNCVILAKMAGFVKEES